MSESESSTSSSAVTARVSRRNHAPEFGPDELAWRAKRFGTRKAAVRAALHAGGKERYTMDDAAKVIEEFLKKPARAVGSSRVRLEEVTWP